MSFDELPPLAPEIGHNSQIAAGMMLGLHFAECIEATARGVDMPAPNETVSRLHDGGDIARLLDLTSAVMGHTPGTNKKALTRFLTALADVLAEHGGELEMMCHKLTHPDEPAKVVLVVSGDEAEEVAAMLTKVHADA